MKLIKTVAVLSVAFAASSVFALPKGFQANPTGATTNSIQVEGVKHIGVTLENEGEHKGKAAIFVSDTKAVLGTPGKGIANNKPVSFAKIDATANRFFVRTLAHGVLGKDKNGVTVANLYRMTGAWHLIPRMPDHSHLGRLSYSKVGNLDVYFGDWSAVPSGAAAGTKGTNYTAFYSGTGRTTNLPTSGTATYTVKGINQYHAQNTALLNGTLKADFGKKTLNGDLKRTGLTVAINSAINTSQASFAGKATANGTVGKARGHFFGNQGAAIAGVAEFGRNHAHNTAFGGTKTGK